ncbi:peroxiredoxin [uncultured Fibrobacter sp.]|uniref:peroxiredoxin family protein n=1 Tax=uncultured Fibrobacter sp. TaxID=261512 RepID=UPI0025DBE5A4|nr:redoxin domain-containing protein [uncultured Fibrobacter sp.]
MSVKKLLILALIVAAAYYVFGVKGFNPFTPKIPGDVQLYALNGETTTLDNLTGENGTLIFSMGTWCSFCVEEVGVLKSLAEDLRTNKINVVICMNGYSNDEIHNWIYKQDFPWDWKTVYWQDSLYDTFHIKKKTVPYLTARNKKGEIFYSNSGIHYTNALSEIAANMHKN